MKLIKFLGVIVLASTVFSCNNKKTVTKESLKTEVDSVSYAIGLNMAFGLKQNLKASFDEGNLELIKEGFFNALDSTDILIGEDKVQLIIETYFQKNQAKIQQKQQEAAAKEAEKQFAEVKSASEKFLEENKTKDGVKTTASGLQYIVEKEGTGAKPTDENTVSIYYKGALIDGTVFDSTAEGEPLNRLRVNQFVPGFSEGLKLMSVGSKYKVFIPQELGYGANPQPGGPIKPFSALVFEIELLEIVN